MRVLFGVLLWLAVIGWMIAMLVKFFTAWQQHDVINLAGWGFSIAFLQLAIIGVGRQ